MAEDEGFVRRWSRRKGLARREPLADTRRSDDRGDAAAPQMARAAPAKRDAAPSDEPRFAVEDLPEIDSLHAESDFTAFLRDGVPEELRRTALRRLWRLDPVFSDLDGLLEYGEDYTDAATVVENLKTAYRVGRGFISDEEAAAEAAETSEAGEAIPAGESAAGSSGEPPPEPDIADGRTVVADDATRDKAHRS